MSHSSFFHLCVCLCVCSDGVGRTGVFVCIYTQLERAKSEGVADIFHFIRGARGRHPGFVQSLVWSVTTFVLLLSLYMSVN